MNCNPYKTDTECLQKATLSVLDCMLDQHGDGDSARAYYHVLEADESGRPPDDPLFKKKDWSAFQIIAKRGDKVSQKF